MGVAILLALLSAPLLYGLSWGLESPTGGAERKFFKVLLCTLSPVLPVMTVVVDVYTSDSNVRFPTTFIALLITTFAAPPCLHALMKPAEFEPDRVSCLGVVLATVLVSPLAAFVGVSLGDLSHGMFAPLRFLNPIFLVLAALTLMPVWAIWRSMAVVFSSTKEGA